MCLYHTYQWSCCPGTAQPAPYYMNSKCDIASAPRKSHKNTSKCVIEHRILDGADHDQPCPNCGQTASDPVEDQNPPQETVDPKDEQLEWAVGKLLQQQEALAALNAARKEKKPLKPSRIQKKR